MKVLPPWAKERPTSSSSGCVRVESQAKCHHQETFELSPSVFLLYWTVSTTGLHGSGTQLSDLAKLITAGCPE